ncbi:MAG: ABC transporter substrate-binding protein [Haloferacaceae archaeon]
MTSDDTRTRRRYLKLTGLAGIGALAGCAGGGTGGGGSTPTETATEGGGMTTTTTSGDSMSGGGSGGEPVPMGTILPITGALSAYGSGMQKSANLAVEHVNAGGGPLGREITVFNKNSQTQPSKALQQYSTLVNENNIIGFVGAASSGVSVPLAQRVHADKVMQVSNASTTPALAEIGYGDDGEPPKYFARTAPNDGQQGIVMGQILNQDKYIGADKAAFLYVDNPYGEGLAKKARAAFDGETTAMVGYSKKTTDYSSTLDKVFADNPDGVGFVGYPGNGKTIFKQWSEGGYGGQWALSEGINSPELFKEMSSVFSDMYVASPDPESTMGSQRFKEAIGDANTLFAAHAYDAMFLQALAMHKAGEASGEAIAKNIRAVSRPNDADVTVTVDEFETAKQALDDGKTINYEGASSPVDLNPSLEPLNRFAILQIGDDGSTTTREQIPRSFFEGKL